MLSYGGRFPFVSVSVWFSQWLLVASEVSLVWVGSPRS